MKISLQLILEHIDTEKGGFRTLGGLNARYSRIMLYRAGSVPAEETVYVCDGIPDADCLETAGCGVIIVNPVDRVPMDTSCECVIYEGGYTYQEILNRTIDSFLEIQGQIESFMKLIGRNSSLQTLAESMYDIFHNPVYMVDVNFKVLAIERRFEMRLLSATWKRLEDEEYMPLNIVSGLIESGELDRLETDKHAHIVTSPYFYTRFINCYLRYGRSIQGHLFVIEMFNPFTPGDVEMADILSPLVMDAILGDEELQRGRGRIYENFMKDLFSGKPMNRSFISSQLPYLGLKKGSVYMIAKIPAPSRDMINDRVASQLERTTDVRISRYEEYLMALFQLSGKDAAASLIHRLDDMAGHWKFRIGTSDFYKDIYKTHVYAVQASRAFELSAEGSGTCVYRYNDFALKDLLDQPVEMKDRFFPPEITEMAAYDGAHGTSYAQTLFVFLKNERRLLETADELCIHRNTLSYRLERMKAVFGIDLDSSENKYRYYLSLKMIG